MPTLDAYRFTIFQAAMRVIGLFFALRDTNRIKLVSPSSSNGRDCVMYLSSHCPAISPNGTNLCFKPLPSTAREALQNLPPVELANGVK